MNSAEAQAKTKRNLALDPAWPPKNSSNPRYRSRGTVDATAHALNPRPVRKAVEDACKRALVLWPNAKAAILYGSRARGDHRVDSDWDIAFITGNERSMPDSVRCVLNELRDHSEIDVQALAMPQQRFLESANSFGSIAAPIAREGRTIAGHCEWPETESEPTLKPLIYEQWRSGGFEDIASASTNLGTVIKIADEGIDHRHIGKFVAATSDAAENFAKIAFGKLASGTGATIPKRHQVDEIIEKLDHALEQNVGPNSAWWQSESGKQFRELLCKMNGHCHEDHQSGYPAEAPPVADEITRAAHRLLATVSFATQEVECLPGPGGLRQSAATVARYQWKPVLKSVRRLRRILRAHESTGQTFSAAKSELAESASAAASCGKEVAQAIEKLADYLYVEMGSAGRNEANPVVYVAGFCRDGKPLAIADDAESIIDWADEVSGFQLTRIGAGFELTDYGSFDQALGVLGFASTPLPRILSESEAVELVQAEKRLEPDESELRKALAKRLLGR